MDDRSTKRLCTSLVDWFSEWLSAVLHVEGDSLQMTWCRSKTLPDTAVVDNLILADGSINLGVKSSRRDPSEKSRRCRKRPAVTGRKRNNPQRDVTWRFLTLSDGNIKNLPYTAPVRATHGQSLHTDADGSLKTRDKYSEKDIGKHLRASHRSRRVQAMIRFREKIKSAVEIAFLLFSEKQSKIKERERSSI
ncbi:hypothetical protein CBL_03272 [Carabus blaptoides fortunei]